MKTLLLYFLPCLTLSKNVLAGKEPAYALTLEALKECKGSNLRDYVILDYLKMFPNHTSSGFVEVVENLPTTATINFQAYTQTNTTWVASPLSIENLDLCRFLEKDVWFVPLGRLMINLPECCPIRKGYMRFKTMIVYKRAKGIIPAGCFKSRLTIMNKNKSLWCVDAVIKITEYSKRYESKCISI